jgi:hypothetical protein
MKDAISFWRDPKRNSSFGPEVSRLLLSTRHCTNGSSKRMLLTRVLLLTLTGIQLHQYVGDFSKFMKKTFVESLEFYIDALPKPSNLQVEFIAPEIILGEEISKGLKEKIIPVVIDEQGYKRADFRFLRGDLISSKPELDVVSKIRYGLNANNSSATGEVFLAIGNSGAGKTKSEFDIGQQQFIMYYDCPGRFLFAFLIW